MTTARTIAGHKIMLTPGVRYRASRPMIGSDDYDVTIQPIDGSAVETEVVRGLTYRESNRLINAFNNGASSFEGRIW